MPAKLLCPATKHIKLLHKTKKIQIEIIKLIKKEMFVILVKTLKELCTLSIDVAVC